MLNADFQPRGSMLSPAFQGRYAEGGWPAAVNIGCGFDKRPGYLNVDMDPACEPDVLIRDNDFSVLPRQGFELILARDVIEHVPRELTTAALLEWNDLLKVGGRLQLQTSSITGVADMMRSESFAQQHGWTKCLFGNQKHPGDYHFTGFTDRTLTVYLRAAGFECGPVTTSDGWLLDVEGVKTWDWTAPLNEDVSDPDFAHRCYQFALGREPDPDGLTASLELLADGMSRRDLLKKVCASEERAYQTASAAGL